MREKSVLTLRGMPKGQCCVCEKSLTVGEAREEDEQRH